MRRKTLKLLAFTGAIALGAATTSHVFAQTVVPITFSTTSAITVANVSALDFGTWVAQIGAVDDGANDVTLTLTDDTSVAATSGGVTDSVLIQVTAPATEGAITVDTPAPAVLTMTRDSSNAISDANITLTAVSYRTATQAGNIDSDLDTATVTVLVGAGTAETVTFGGELTFLATPTDNAHTGDFTVSFSY